MGRRRTKLQVSARQRAELMTQIHATTDAREKERLDVVLRAADGRHTLEDLARHAGRARSCIQVWLDKFVGGGIAGLLERDAPPGASSPIGDKKVQTQLQARLKAGHLRTAAEVAAWLKEAHGITRSRKSLYYWLNK